MISNPPETPMTSASVVGNQVPQIPAMFKFTQLHRPQNHTPLGLLRIASNKRLEFFPVFAKRRLHQRRESCGAPRVEQTGLETWQCVGELGEFSYIPIDRRVRIVKASTVVTRRIAPRWELEGHLRPKELLVIHRGSKWLCGLL